MAADLPTRLDLFQLGRDSITAANPRISLDQVNTLGSDVNIIVGLTAVLAYHTLQHLAYRIAAVYLDSAEGDDLDRLLNDRYRLPRKGASPSVVPVRIYRATAASGAGNVPIGTRLKSLTGVEFVTTSTGVFGSTDLTVQGGTVNAQAAQSGSNTKVGANAIQTFSNVQLLWDVTLQCNNDTKSASGEDREDDDTYRERGRAYWLTARRGTLAAIEQGAKTIAGVVSAQAVESLGYGGTSLPSRVVQLYAADSSGLSNQVLANTIMSGLDDYRAAGIPVIVVTGLPQIVDIAVHLVFKATATGTDALTAAILTAIVEFVNQLGVNQALTRGAISGVLQRFANDGLVVDQSAIVSPTGDLVPDAGKTIRTTLTNTKAV